MEAAMFLENQWYVAAWSKDIGRKPSGHIFLKQRAVLYRREDGRAIALEDCCPHRNLPLSMGRVIGNDIECGYHGLLFDSSGICKHAPNEKAVPKWACVRAYPLVERHGWAFIWMGDPQKADPLLIPDFHRPLSDPNWSFVGDVFHVQCSYLFIIDNLLDLSHLAYVHSSTTGNRALAENAAVKTETPGNHHVRVTRSMRNIPAAPAYAAYGGYSGNCDRWQIANFYPPSYIFINNGSYPPGQTPADVDENTSQGHWGFQVYQIMTPIDEKTCYLFWAVAHDNKYFHNTKDRDTFHQQIKVVLIEDKNVYEGQQRCIAWDHEARGDINARGALEADRGLLKARSIVRRLLREEAKEAGSRVAAE
jgi:phenylpropionate dioxygenase-like ring-hydroxylating dioxygenase large terminal subunit